ncbi:MAG TPA: hypothetical protein VFV28_03295 [Limnobacter sp.]|nr:hypothetical protein [Limnobacter sp.]
MDAINLKEIYTNLIAGRLPVGAGNPQKVVMNQAYAILGTDRLHACFTERAGHVYYFAIESTYLSSAPGFTLPFVDVLPGGPLHAGDGIYLLQGSDYSAALITEAGNIRLVCNDPDVLKDYLLGIDLPIQEISNRGGKPLTSIPQAIQGITERFSALLLKGSLGVLVTASAVFLGSQAASAYTTRQLNQGLNARAVEADLNATLAKLSVQQPLARQISRIQKVSSTVVRAGGWIEKYRLIGEDKESFELILPSWVSQDYLDTLGRDVVTDLRDIEGLLTVRKQNNREAAK